MRLRNFLAATAAVALSSAPIAAQAAETPMARESAPVKGEEIGGGFLLPLVAVLAVIVAVVLITDDGDEEPESP